MNKRAINRRLNRILLAAATAAFSTGIVFLVCFHAGSGASAESALGQSRLFWLNLHRLSAAVTIICAIAHIELHWRSFLSIITSVFSGKKQRSRHSELIMYAVFSIATLTGLVAWLILEGSSPLFGPTIIGRPDSIRHSWIDTHHVSSMISLLLIAHHIGHRRRTLFRR